MTADDLFAYANPFLNIASFDAALDASSDDDTPTGVYLVADSGRPPDEEIAVLQLTEAVERFVAGLSPRQQQIVRSLYWDGESQAEIARDLRVTKSAVSQALAKVHRLGRNHLREAEQLLSLH
jgi:RNA polymerase sigma factor (sigma-70 family)